jgi:hypothetical protein
LNEELSAYRAINADFKSNEAEIRRARIVIWIMSTAFAVAFGMVLATGAYAHEAMSGIPYPAICCNGNAHHGDCQAISSKAVQAVPGGYRVTLGIGDHWMVTKGHVFDVPQAKVRDSEDGQFHICLYPDENNNQCFFAPPPGV